MKRFYYIILGMTTLILSACEGTGYVAVKSSIAQLTAFTFAKNDSIPGLAAAKFTVQELLDTGLVTTGRDSMLYGTRLDSVVPRFAFAATPSAAYLTMPDTVCILTGYDTLDFTKQPIYLTIRSQDGINTKVYQIVPTVHQMDPDLYDWNRLTEAVYAAGETEQQVLEQAYDFVLIKSAGGVLTAYRSSDGATWNELGTPSGLPAGTKVRQIVSNGDTLFYADGTTVYLSTDALNWTANTVDYEVVTMLMEWDNRIWALVGNNGYQLAYWSNGGLDTTALRPGNRFPVRDFAAVEFLSSSLRKRAMIVGGYTADGTALNTRWSMEHTEYPRPNGTYRMEEFSVGRPAFKSLAGVAVVWYNKQLMMFGGVDAEMNYRGRDILVSRDEGITWTLTDTLKNRLPDTYQARQRQTAIVRDNAIYLFGGQDADNCYSDVYRGKLNSIDWDD